MIRKAFIVCLGFSISFLIMQNVFAQGCGGGYGSGPWWWGEDCGYGPSYWLVDDDGDGYADETAVPFVDENGNGYHDGYYGFSNGGQIFYTATNEQCDRIPYYFGNSSLYKVGAQMMGMPMMMGSVTCAACHGPDGQGQRYYMHMYYMETPDIRWEALTGEAVDEHGDEEEENNHNDEHEGYDLDAFKEAVTKGKHPDGEPLSFFMPRWLMNDNDIEDLVEYLKSLPY